MACTNPGFFANGGVYFDNKVEVQIFDSHSLLQAINGGSLIIEGERHAVSGGVNDATGEVTLLGGPADKQWVSDEMNGLIYIQVYSEGAKKTRADLENAAAGPVTGTLEMTFTRFDVLSPLPGHYRYNVEVRLNGSVVAVATDLVGTGGGASTGRDPETEIRFQQHWAVVSNIHAFR